MDAATALTQGRELFAREAWGEAFTRLSQADESTRLDPQDLERLAMSAYLVGEEAPGDSAFERAFREYFSREDTVDAVRVAFWLGFRLVNRGEQARGGGWLARAGRLLEENDLKCVERGFMLLPGALQALDSGEYRVAHEMFVQVGEIASEFDNSDLMVMSRLGQGQALVKLDRPERGISMLDEAMVSIIAGEVSPIVVGILYCAAIDTCHQIFDVRRAREWTEALTNWCESHPNLVPFRGQCLVFRSEILRLGGDWPDAMDAADQACLQLQRFPWEPGHGDAFYARGELHRLRGEFDRAEAEYRQASGEGRIPEPGMVLLRLARGNVESASTTIRRLLDDPGPGPARLELSRANVAVMLAVGDIAAARASADELGEIDRQLDSARAHAIALEADGEVSLAEGQPQKALGSLRNAWNDWRELAFPYEAARVRVLIGRACRQLGDEDSASLEFEAAQTVFQRLGAAPDLATVKALMQGGRKRSVSGLTVRESEVLRLVAGGMTNRAIATELFISEKTVARHVSNIFGKLGISSRSAATAYAYEHGLLSRPT